MKSASIHLLPLLLLGSTSCKTTPSGSSEASQVRNSKVAAVKTYDFTTESKTFASQGVAFFFSDIPSDQKTNFIDLKKLKGATLLEKMTSEIILAGGPSLYQLRQVFDANKDARGQAIGYHNRSDDVDTNLTIKVSDDGTQKLKPNTVYKVSAKLNFYTNVTSASFGVGGSADSNAYGMIVSPSPFVLKTAADDLSGGPKEHYGHAARFYLEDNELPDLAGEVIDTISGAELEVLLSKLQPAPEDETEMRNAGIKVLVQIMKDILNKKSASQDALSKKLVAKIDKTIEAKLADLSPEDIEGLKGSGGSGSPVMAAASGTTSNSGLYLRTFTQDENKKEIRVGVPAGDCTSGLRDLTPVQRWTCDHYSYMGRINNGLNEISWRANSISTAKPVQIKTDAQGSPIYVNLTSHSGFEGLTLFYVSGIELTISE